MKLLRKRFIGFFLILAFPMSPILSFTESEIVESSKKLFTSLSLPFIIEDSLKLCIEKIRFIAEINKLQEKEILTNLLEWVNRQDSYHTEKLNPELKKGRNSNQLVAQSVSRFYHLSHTPFGGLHIRRN